jgi:hypothetical protein
MYGQIVRNQELLWNTAQASIRLTCLRRPDLVDDSDRKLSCGSDAWKVEVPSEGARSTRFLMFRLHRSYPKRLRDVSLIPSHFALLANRPNPFVTRTAVEFLVPEVAQVRLRIFDVKGHLVRTLTDRIYGAGRWSVEWDRRDATGHMVPGGVYLYRMESGRYHAQRKMLLF